MNNGTYEQLKAQIKSIATSKYPQMQNFNLSDKSLRSFLKKHKGDLDKIVDELYQIVGVGNSK